MKFLIFTFASLLTWFGFYQKEIVPAPVKICTTCDALSGVEKLVCLADEFKTTLSASQITTLQIDRTLVNAKKWSNLPVGMGGRPGLRFADLSATQLAAAKALIKEATGTTLSEGYDELIGHWAADQYLAANGGGSGYGDGLYYIAFLGAPSLTGDWELMTGGHHVAVANNYSAGQFSGATPSFRGIEPFASFTQGGTTYQPLVQERDSLAAMLASLSTAELATAKLSGSFGDLLLGPNKDWQFPTTKSGIKCSTLTAAQKNLVQAAIKTYVADMNDADAATIMALYAAGLDETWISYAGNTNLLNQGDYVRIDGPRVWIEYSTQNGIVLSPKHPHSVWRDHQSDYGGLGNPSVSTAAANPFTGKFEIFPNPAQSVCNLQLELEKSAMVSINLFDMSGKKVLAGLKFNMTSGSHTLPLEVQNLPNGIYNCILEVKTGDVISLATRQLTKI